MSPLPSFFSRLRSFFAELRRRNVWKVAVAYAGAAFVVIQVADLTFPRLGFPPWTVTFVIVLVALGFPFAVVIAWAFELTPDGVRRTPRPRETRKPSVGGEGAAGGELVIPGGTERTPRPEADEADDRPRRLAVNLLAALGLLAVASAGVWHFTSLGGGGEGSADPAARTRSVAVLPFDDISPDTGNAFFARGMHEEVLTQLSKISGLRVLSRTSVLQYGDTEKTVGEISRELGGVGAILEGSVRRAGNRVRITVQLIDAREDAHLWAETFDRELTPEAIFQVQGEIAARISEALAAELTSEERRRIEQAPTADLAAYDAYLRGRSLIWKHWEFTDPAGVDSAIVVLREAVRRDSTFAPAHAWLGLGYNARATLSRTERWRDSALAAAHRAEELRSDLAIAHVTLALIHWSRGVAGASEAFEKALAEGRRAVELQPSSPLAAATMLLAHDWMDNRLEATRWAFRAAELEPNEPLYLQSVAVGLYRVGLLEAADTWVRRALEEDPDYWRSVRMRAAIDAERNGPAQGLRVLEGFLEKHPEHEGALSGAAHYALRMDRPARARELLLRAREARAASFPEGSKSRPKEIDLPPRDRATLGYAELLLGNSDRGRALLRQALEEEIRRGSRTGWHHADVGRMHSALGNRSDALHHLERAVEQGYYASELDSPLWGPVRETSRFRKLEERARTNWRQQREQVRALDVDLYPPGSSGGSGP